MPPGWRDEFLGRDRVLHLGIAGVCVQREVGGVQPTCVDLLLNSSAECQKWSVRVYILNILSPSYFVTEELRCCHAESDQCLGWCLFCSH